MSLAERMNAVTTSVRNYFEGLNDRERRLLGALFSVAVLVFVVLPMYLVLDSIAARETENRELLALLRELDQQGDALVRRKAERDAVRNLFRQPVPALGGFLESNARTRSLDLREVTDTPDQEVAGFRRHRVTAAFPSAGIEPIMQMLETVENSTFPVSISKIEADRAGDGHFNFRIGVDAYEQNAEQEEGGARRTERRSGESSR